MKKFIKWILDFFRRVDKLEIGIYAAYAAYFVLLSVFPAVMLAIGVLRLTALSPDVLERVMKSLMPSTLDSLIDYMVRELFAVNSVAFLSVGAVSAFWMASKGVYSLLRGLNKVYAVEENRSGLALRLRCFGFTLLLFGVLLLCASLVIFGQKLAKLLDSSGATGPLRWLLQNRLIINTLLLTQVFALVYAFLPNKRERYLSCLPGALVSAFLWVVFTRLFSAYVEHFGNYSLYYGSLTVIAIAMLWLYTSMFILLCGAFLNTQISVSWQKKHKAPRKEEKA